MIAPKAFSITCTVATVQKIIDRFKHANRTWGTWNIDLIAVQTMEDLPQDVKNFIIRQYGREDKYAKGILYGNTVYLVAENHQSNADIEQTILHEIYGHIGIRRLFGAEITRKLNELYVQLGGIRGLNAIAVKRGISLNLSGYAIVLGESNFSDEQRIRIMMEEALAHCVDSPRFGDTCKAIIGGVRAWLRNCGLIALGNLGETDLLYVLKKAGEKLNSKLLHKPGNSEYGSGMAHGQSMQNLNETEAMVV